MNEIVQAISTVGFPIAACCFLLWQNSKQDQYNREQQEKLRQTIDSNTESIKDLGKLIQKLFAMIGGNQDV
jgi:hypothetical protein